jgi:hypothetical protein
MSLNQIRTEVYYYTGREVTDEELEEIIDFKNENPHASLSEIVHDYYEG